MLINYVSWFIRPGHLQGVFWILMTALSSVINDVFMCHLGTSLPVSEITFFRFFFSGLILTPFILKRGINLQTKNNKLHLYRILLGAIALWLCCYSVTCISLSENTAILFTQPLFFLPLALIFLKEKINRSRLITTTIGFIGLAYIVYPTQEELSFYSLIPMMAALLFALSDIVTKKIVHDESVLAILFYFSLGTSLITFPFALWYWQTPSLDLMIYLALLGAGSNIIQVCLFMAFKSTDASALGPFRYVELIFSALFGYIFFNQILTVRVLIGSIIIISSTIYLSYMEAKNQ